MNKMYPAPQNTLSSYFPEVPESYEMVDNPDTCLYTNILYIRTLIYHIILVKIELQLITYLLFIHYSTSPKSISNFHLKSLGTGLSFFIHKIHPSHITWPENW